MTIKQFVGEILDSVENHFCYLAIMPNDEGFDIEVEVNAGSIAGNYATNTKDLNVAREIANEIERELEIHNIEVAQTRDEWEDYLDN